MNGLSVKSYSFGKAWKQLLAHLTAGGDEVSPRGMKTKEHLAVQFHVEDMLNNILVDSIRKPSYRFMVAEWLWMMSGRDDVSSISKFSSVIKNFSDDGVFFYGAYGPRLKMQFKHIISALVADPTSRQAVATMWIQNPEPSKDIPCTISYQALLRNGFLHGVVNMRSSDIWLGLPYDFFNFSMISNVIAACLKVSVGSMTFNLGSSHLYETNWEAANRILASRETGSIFSKPLYSLAESPSEKFVDIQTTLSNTFSSVVDSVEPSKYYLNYRNILLAKNNEEAFLELTS